ncbi:hypothetical protein AZZ69_003901, partial [Klebsiella pneumoniae]
VLIISNCFVLAFLSFMRYCPTERTLV